jgi:HK97 family phage prohead protease
MLLKKRLPFSDVQIKFSGDSGKFEGYGSVFGGVDSYEDTILPGAFKHVTDLPKMFLNHDWEAIPVGKYTHMEEDSRGLLMVGELTMDMSGAKDVYAAMKHETIDGLSIGGYLQKGDYEKKDDGGRVIRKWSKLVEVSIVTFPADSAARIASVKSEDFEFCTIRDFERFLRDAGHSKSEALAIVSKARKLFQGEPESDEGLQTVIARLEQLRSKLS